MNRTEVLPGVWHLEEDYRVYCTLVQGKTLALLWDTGQGRTDLAAYVAQQVPTPCLVLNSHGHSDHIGGNFRFPQVYAHRADWPLLAAYARLTGRETPVCPLEPGQCFALGGRRAEVISLAGHTKGSVGLLLAGEGLLLAGDGLNQTLLLLGAEAAPLSQLTDGIHLHSLSCPDEVSYEHLKARLRELGFLAE
jgi:glyoxylase-like metal-dependent hydrolase (beta-lactamase superfamily II)